MQLSEKQKKILDFPNTKFKTLICDGAVHSGKSTIILETFIKWAMKNFDNNDFALCGLSYQTCSKNIVSQIISNAELKTQYNMDFNREQRYVLIKKHKTANQFYLFNSHDDDSVKKAQYFNFAGAFFDQAPLTPKSFVENIIGCSSIKNSRYWFNTTPLDKSNWFFREWITKSSEKNALYLNFSIDDNQYIPDTIKESYKSMYIGADYQRYILGQWTKKS